MQTPTLSRNLRLLGLEGVQLVAEASQTFLVHEVCIGSHIERRDFASWSELSQGAWAIARAVFRSDL